MCMPPLIDNMRIAVPPSINLSETQLRGLPGMFGLTGDKAFQEAGTLSAGRNQTALAMLMVGRNNLLLLDEPHPDPGRAPRSRSPQRMAMWAIILQSRLRVQWKVCTHQGLANA